MNFLTVSDKLMAELLVYLMKWLVQAPKKLRKSIGTVSLSLSWPSLNLIKKISFLSLCMN